ncbi:MAG: Rne/Rng family ribonuclease [Pseudomonadota bacterium]
MTTELVINVQPWETRVALVENDQVVEFYLERSRERGMAANLYRGRVVRVLPGMQAAFVDIGLPRAAFLHAGDIQARVEDVHDLVNATSLGEPVRGGAGLLIEDLVRENQEILAQVAKEPIGSKGARITTYISLPGRHLVLMPGMQHVGVSRRIEDETERLRLRDIVEAMRPEGFGFILRTASEGVDGSKLAAEMEFLLKLWRDLEERYSRAPVPSLIYRDLNVTLRAVRDLFTKEVDRLVVDNRDSYHEILEFVDTFMPPLRHSVELYEKSEPVFDAYGLETDLVRALARKVWLKSGGYIVIERTEALVVIDVNTGRYVGKRNLEETILKTNLEAVKEIAYQLRLRDIGGIIITDFIDMEKEADREKVYSSLIEALRRDRSRTKVLPMSQLGLVEMTRKRVRGSLADTLLEPCFYCDGEGSLANRLALCFDIFRETERRAAQSVGENLFVSCHPEIADILADEERHSVEELETRLRRRLVIRADPKLHLEQYEVEVF